MRLLAVCLLLLRLFGLHEATDGAAGHACVRAAREHGAVGVYRDPRRRQAHDSVVFMTLGNSGYRELLENWMCHMDRAGFVYLVVALDRGLVDALARSHPHAAVCLLRREQEEDLAAMTEFNAAGFGRLSAMKFVAVRALLAAGYSVLFADADVRFRHDPFPEVLASPCAYTYQSDGDEVAGPDTEGNTGFFYARATPAVAHMHALALAECDAHPELDDQTNFWNAMRAHRPLPFRNATGGYCALDHRRFLCGWAFYGQAHLLPDAVIVHPNYAIGCDVKRERLQTAGLWAC